MDQNEHIKEEWDTASLVWSDFIRKGKDYYRDELNNPATFKLIGEVRGQRVLDVACGEGYNTRILARKGAKVTGVDFSEKLIDLAKQEEAKEELGISYHVMDATDLNKELSSNYFDLVTCFMALQDIKYYKKVISEVDRVLKQQGRFIFSIPHPCFSKIVVNGKKISTTQRYFFEKEVKHPIHWDMERLD
ncbi:MAG: class I SAM-dependent methyltransferase, partial [Candidatus Heimdallarchaeota archaeon]